ncbi:hypothetical protein ATO6_03890 [Oceanicola sp. 22II-s10i]|uniref:PaaI family thioesterase n=1 Tax=Oceanicola sp. 22II-s10i TaxID=1317116 RepID=UPI000B528374|nr:PaaI family thioesterase [Oceanicola sp. 22II-s10i]OWU86019.1 hypothetical protein ATO6_03890 [Oceanicola sp. 22II-s10i]
MKDVMKTPPGEGWEKVEDDGFIGHVGPFWRKDDGKGGEIIGFIADDYHRNINGVVQGGMLMTLADRGMGRQVRHANGGKPVATVNFSYDFIGAGQIGTFVILYPKITKQTGTMTFMESEVHADGELIGRAHGIWRKFKGK